MTQSARADSTVTRAPIQNAICALFAALLLVGGTPLEAANSSPLPCNDPAAASDVVNTVRGAFEALRDDDQNAWSRATTADFLAFDAGARLDGAQLFRAVKTAHAAGKTYVWNVTDPDPHVNCGFAWVDYVNRGSIREPDGKSISVEWLESAVLRYEDGRWRLVFLHSTQVIPKP